MFIMYVVSKSNTPNMQIKNAHAKIKQGQFLKNLDGHCNTKIWRGTGIAKYDSEK